MSGASEQHLVQVRLVPADADEGTQSTAQLVGVGRAGSALEAWTWSPIRCRPSVVTAVSRVSLPVEYRYGAPRFTPARALPKAQWRQVFEVNLFGHIAVAQALLPALLRGKGRVINISSIGGKVAMATYSAYAGAKFALGAVSDSLRREVAPLGVQVIVVEPGGIRTEAAARRIETANRPTADAAARGITKAVTPPPDHVPATPQAGMEPWACAWARYCPTVRSTAFSPPTCAATARRGAGARPTPAPQPSPSAQPLSPDPSPDPLVQSPSVPSVPSGRASARRSRASARSASVGGSSWVRASRQ
ncbi:SDR family NAD(P)-dependent oxidoreductase [Streptomyces sp. NPDC088554]|uniref:SDR family NAD(P)-dependent oxidoreductase n=1 Tax=Streptomyces sp. NPDC088554 TaxID=3365865 RepID=UPI00382BDC4B